MKTLKRRKIIYYLLTRGGKIKFQEIVNYLEINNDIYTGTSTIDKDVRFFKDEFKGNVLTGKLGASIESDLTFIQQLDLLL